MIKISSFVKAKNNGGGNNNSAGSTGGIVPTIVQTKCPNVKIWGQWHDHTGDVNGDMDVQGSITATGDIKADNIKSNKGIFDSIEASQIKSMLMEAADSVFDSSFIKTLQAGSINTQSLKANAGDIDDLNVTNLNGDTATFRNLSVTGKAHFYELVIDKITASGGAVIFSPADGFKVEKVIWRVECVTNYQNWPSEFLLPTGYKPVFNGNNFKVVQLSCNGVTYFGVELNSSNDNGTWYYIPSNGVLVRKDNAMRYLYPSDWQNYTSYIEADTLLIPKDAITHKITCKEIENDEYDYSISLPYENCSIVDYKVHKFQYVDHDIDGNEMCDNWDIKKAILVDAAANSYIGPEDRAAQVYWFYEDNDWCIDPLTQAFNNLGAYRVFKLANKLSTTELLVSKSNIKLHPYLLFLAEGENGKAIRNEWQVNDQAICRSFNQAKTGNSSNVSNKYYWSRVSEIDYIDSETNSLAYQFDEIVLENGILRGFYMQDEEPHSYHVIGLDANDCDGELDCDMGDEIAMLGNRYDSDRQNAIYISAYSSLDPSLVAPFIAQYEGINDYSLESHKTTWFAANGNKIRGNLCVQSGANVEDMIGDQKNYFENWINNINNDLSHKLDNSYLKVLPAYMIYKSYSEWRETIGNNVTFESQCTWSDDKNCYVFQDGTNNRIFPHDLEEGDKVAVEVKVVQNYQDSTEPNSATALGTVIVKPVSNKQMQFRTVVRIDYIVDTDLSGVWGGMSQLKVDQDGIKMTVMNLDQTLTDKINQGISSFEIKAGQIQSQVDNLQGDLSKITQQADNIQLQVNELSIKLDGQKNKIVLDGDTEVNGVVNINQDGTGLRLVGSGGEQFTIGSNDIGTFKRFDEETKNTWMIVSTGNTYYWHIEPVYNDYYYDDEGYCRYSTQQFTIQKYFGTLKAGQQANLHDINFDIADDVYFPSGYNSTVFGLSFSFIKNGYQVANGMGGINKTFKSGGPIYYDGSKWDANPFLSYTASEDGEYWIRITGTIGGYSPKKVQQPTSPNQPYNPQPQSSSTEIRFTLFVSTSVSAFGKLTYNGFGFNFGGGKVAFIGSDQMTFKMNPNCGWKLDTANGFQKLIPERYYVNYDGLGPFDVQSSSSYELGYPENGGNWVGINDMVVRKIKYITGLSGTNTCVIPVSLMDEMLVVSTLPSKQNLIVCLPKPEDAIGKKYMIKNVLYGSDGIVWVYGYGMSNVTYKYQKILHSRGNALLNDSFTGKWRNTDNTSFAGLCKIEKISMMFVSTGGYWIAYYCD